MNLSDLSPFAPTVGAFVATTAILFLLRIPQASRTVSDTYERLVVRLNEQRVTLEKDMAALRILHNECETRADGLELRVRALEEERSKL